MSITVNGKHTDLDGAVTVRELLTRSNVDMPDYVTVQINEAIIPSGEFDSRLIADGDVIDFLYYMGGGR